MTEEYEIDPELQKLEEEAERLASMKEHFKKPIEAVDETFLRNYFDWKKDVTMIEKNLEGMKKLIEGARMPGETTLQVGKMAAFFTEVPPTEAIDWEAMFRFVNGAPDAELLKKFTKPGRKGYTQVTVKSLGQ